MPTPMLNPPPRSVPPSLLLRLVCGNLLHQLGWALGALGLALGWGILLAPDVSAFGPDGPFGLLALLPGVGGLLLVALGLWLGVRKVRLLRNGLLATARFVDRRETNTAVNEQPVWALGYAFRGDDMHEHRAVLRTHRPQALGEAAQQVLFAPGRPDRALLVASLTGKFQIDPSGDLAPVGFVAAVLLPATVLVGAVVSLAALVAL